MKTRIIAAVVAAAALGAVVGPRLEARQEAVQAPAKHYSFSHTFTAVEGMDEVLTKLDGEGWEVTEVVPLGANPNPHLSTLLVVARKPVK